MQWILECHTFDTLTTMNSGTKFYVHIFCSRPINNKTGVSREKLPPPTTVLQKGREWLGVSVGNHHFFPICLVNEPIPGTPRQASEWFTQIFEVWLFMVNNKSYLTGQIWLIIDHKQSYFEYLREPFGGLPRGAWNRLVHKTNGEKMMISDGNA